MNTTLNIETVHLDQGSHRNPNEGHCLLEVVSMFAKEPFTSRPACVSSYLRSFGIALNDRANDQQRQSLRRFIPLLIGTAGDGLDERRRWLAADHVTRVVTPKWLDRAGLSEHAAALRALAPITDRATYNAAQPTLRAARDAAWTARRERLIDPVREAVKNKLIDSGIDNVSGIAAATVEGVVATTAAAVAADAAAVAADADADAAAVIAAATAAATADAAVDAAVAATTATTAAAAVAADAAADATTTTTTAAAVAADAAAVAVVDKRYWAIRAAVYAKVRAVLEDRYADVFAESWYDALDLFDRLINPTEQTT